MHHPHSLSIFEDNLFWVDRGHKQLIKTSRFNTRNKTSMVELSSQALTVKIAHSTLQPFEENPCVRSNCEHLCLLTKNTPSGYRCECQIGYLKDTTNENRCNIDQTEFLLVLNDNIIGGLKIFSNDTTQTDESSVQIPTNDKDEASSDSPLSTDESILATLTRDSGFVWSRMTPVNDISFGYDFTYDYRDQYIYWLQHSPNTYSLNIQRVKFDGENREVFVSTDDEVFSSPFCLEFDPYSRNLIVGNLIQSFIEIINADNK